jgi:Flp pilus assembly CpaE family ATPase
MNITRLKYAIKKTWFAYAAFLVLSVPVIWLHTNMPFEPIATLSPTLRNLERMTYALVAVCDALLVAGFCMFGYYTRYFYMEEIRDQKFFDMLRRRTQGLDTRFSVLTKT